MPARQEIRTGRSNFLHRAGAHSHLATDHYDCWGDGSGTFSAALARAAAIRREFARP